MRAIIIFLFAEIRDGKIRQKIDKTSFRLCYQAVSGTGCHDK